MVRLLIRISLHYRRQFITFTLADKKFTSNVQVIHWRPKRMDSDVCKRLRKSFTILLQCTFYARKQNAASRVFAIVWASVRLSVRLSVCHTHELYQNGAS